jgi:murein DD-endopeptidase MepM/ murein hydrolase activator NlpD
MAKVVSASGWRWIVLAIVGVGAFIFAAPRFESDPPTLDVPESLILGKAGGVFRFRLADTGTGVRSYALRIRHAGGAIDVAEASFPGDLLTGAAAGEDAHMIEIPLDPQALKLGDGSATLILTARDFSWQLSMRGNRSERSIPLVIDTRPPRIKARGGLTYLHRGGAAAAVYDVDEATGRDGIVVGDDFYPGHPLPNSPAGSGQRVAIFAVAVAAPSEPAIEIEAVDLAGNATRTRFAARVSERRFPREDIQLGARFFENVVPALADKVGVREPDPVEAFKVINSEIRARDEARIREIIRDGSSEQLWEGAFKQMANSKVMSGFAERRHYFTAGKEISRATHYGFDLASNARAPIAAANSGRVLHAAELGIYGNCVLIDHGLGLASLYGHLSSIDVQVGDEVSKNQVLGRSGATGLAGGDHLHFAILVGDTYVDPIEWWDGRWVQSHVEVRLTSSQP